jgi:hypothetical protein
MGRIGEVGVSAEVFEELKDIILVDGVNGCLK